MAHFEIDAADVSAAKAFYGDLLGWTFETMPGGDMPDDDLATGDGASPRNASSVGLMRRPDEAPAPGGPIRCGTMTSEIADCDARHEWASANCGSEALPLQDRPGIGRCAYVEDGQGNVVGIVTPEGDR